MRRSVLLLAMAVALGACSTDPEGTRPGLRRTRSRSRPEPERLARFRPSESSATATMATKVGRAGWLADRAAGHEDAGARLVAMAIWAAAVDRPAR